MSTGRIFEDEDLEKLRLRLFPRAPWTAAGPVRRRYRAKAAREGQSVADALAALAIAEGFVGPGREPVYGSPADCLAAFQAGDREDTLVFGDGPEAVWCDLALGQPDGDGWQELIVRSERGENLVALASGVRALRFRRAE